MADLTREHLEVFVFDPHCAAESEIQAMARELLVARARIAELERRVASDRVKTAAAVLNLECQASAERERACARITELESEAQADQRAIEEARDERDEAVAKRDERVDYDGRLAYLGGMSRRLLDEKTEACRWAAWFAAERDYLRAEVAKDNAAIAEKQRRDSARITELEEQRSVTRNMARLRGARITELEATASRYAVIHVEPRPGSEAWPVVERVSDGWQSGAHHYADADVLGVKPIVPVEEPGA